MEAVAVVDTVSPDLAASGIEITAANLNDSTNTSVVTITFTEAVTEFNNSDITVTGGTLSTVGSNDGGVTWSGIFTASDDSTANGTITIGTDYQDLVGNVGANGDTDSVVVDTTNPTATVTFAADGLNDDTNESLVTIVFSEAVANFGNADVSVVGGTLGTLTSADQITWTATFTASDDSTEEASVTVIGAYEDGAGNIGATGADDTATVDTTNPTATIVFDKTSLKKETGGDGADESIVTITFSEGVTAFSNEDLVVEGGTLTELTSNVSNTVWTGTFTATDDSTTVSYTHLTLPTKRIV